MVRNWQRVLFEPKMFEVFEFDEIMRFEMILSLRLTFIPLLLLLNTLLLHRITDKYWTD